MKNESTGTVRAYEAIGFLLCNPTCEKSISGSVFPSLLWSLNTTWPLMFLISIRLGTSGQNLHGGNHKNQFLPGGQKLLRNKGNAPKLELQIEPQLEHRRKRKGFSIHVHLNNQAHFILHDVGVRKVQIELPIGPLYLGYPTPRSLPRGHPVGHIRHAAESKTSLRGQLASSFHAAKANV